LSELPADQIRAELWQLYEEWFAAIPDQDQSFFQRVLSPDWHYTSYYGQVRGKSEYLEYIAPVRADAPVNRLLELDVRPFGDLVVVHGLYVVADEFAPPGGPDTRFTAVWQHRDGEWQALAHHATTVAESS
jgi:hypothetical protein